MNSIVAEIAKFMWGPWMLTLLLGTGVWLSICLRGIQIRSLAYAFQLTFSKERGGDGDISHFGSLMTSLAATVGTGNIAGVSTAVALGGPGAIFWMWVTGLVGMATKYAEGFLAVKYRHINAHGEFSGGPMYYLEFGLKQKWLGSSFAIFGALAAFGIGNMIQSNTIASSLSKTLGTNDFLVGVILALLTGMVILGGIKRIADVTSYFVPLMVLIYFIGATVVILNNLSHLGSGIALIFEHAFTGTAATGGFVGATLAQTIRFGVARGLFSNESGMGSAPIVAAAARTNHPEKQALVSMTGTFLDTLIICSLTALALSSSGVWVSGETGVALTIEAFSTSFPGQWGNIIVSLSAVTFGFSTILAWEYYGEKCFEYLFNERWIYLYRYAWVFFVLLGALFELEIVWNFADVMNALMAIPNLIGLLLLGRIVSRETGSFEEGIDKGTINKLD
jgi:alanine or glycine:cation symporter, AGCS family